MDSLNELEFYGKSFKDEVCSFSTEIDPSNEQDWFSLSLGWAIAKGLTPDEAWQFSTWLRYTVHYYNTK